MKTSRSAKDFPIVCVGGSAGGLDAYTRLLTHLPDEMGIAIVIVNHLRTVATLLHEILPRFTRMPVERITDRLERKGRSGNLGICNGVSNFLDRPFTAHTPADIEHTVRAAAAAFRTL